MKIKSIGQIKKAQLRGLEKLRPDNIRIAVGMSTCGAGMGAEEVFLGFEKALKRLSMEAFLTRTGCFGYCAEEPLVNILIPGFPLLVFSRVTPDDTLEILKKIKKGQVTSLKPFFQVTGWDHHTGRIAYGKKLDGIPLWD